MTQARKSIAAAVSATLVLVIGALVWLATAKHERVIEIPPVAGAQR